jgi:hypothetical protein
MKKGKLIGWILSLEKGSDKKFDEVEVDKENRLRIFIDNEELRKSQKIWNRRGYSTERIPLYKR